MADNTAIEWTDGTWNPIRGCTRVSEGCRNCYAEVMAARFSDPGQWGHGLARRVALPGGGTDHRWTGEVALVDEALDLPLRCRRPRRIFVNSTSDLFHEKVPDAWIDRVFAVMALAPQHTFQVLTKRPERMRAYLCQPGRTGDVLDACLGYLQTPDHAKPRMVEDGIQLLTLPNVWLGTSVEDQATANARIPHLLATPAQVRFLSCEPLLGPVALDMILTPEMGIYALTGVRSDGSGPSGFSRGPRIDWVICGGESGPGARPMHPDWAISLRDQCQAAGVPFFFKQWGDWEPRGGFACPDDLPREGWHHFDPECSMRRVGKKNAGRLLDGREWNEVPNGQG